ncbi:MAG: hypothetical protein ACLRJC_06300 [Emergencia timonensis]|uniref:hypothetical protein n=1 Tax=Emergencia timonensis TaxID=1776384 RepID=UPI00082FA5B2|nr:hypothetical protein [Emergencia timonensis]WNX88212.1 hypothetical protein RVY71_18695 [Emergencia timonensis]
MKISEIASTIEELSYDARTINSIQEVFFQAIFRGETTPESFDWAFDAFGKFAFCFSNKMAKLRDDTYEQMSKERSEEIVEN